MSHFLCQTCKRMFPVLTNIGIGYGIDRDNNKHCHQCCANNQLEAMRKTGRATLYYIGDSVTDWAGKLRFKVLYTKVSRHNMASKRYDFWFLVDGLIWHGFNVGDNNQIAHCKRTKKTYGQWLKA